MGQLLVISSVELWISAYSEVLTLQRDYMTEVLILVFLKFKWDSVEDRFKNYAYYSDQVNQSEFRSL